MTRSTVSEHDVQSAIVQALTMYGFPVLRINSGAHVEAATETHARRFIRFVSWQAAGYGKQQSGVSDILALDKQGRLWAIEVKAPGKIRNVSENQTAFLAEVASRGGIALVVDNLDNLIAEIHRKGTGEL